MNIISSLQAATKHRELVRMIEVWENYNLVESGLQLFFRNNPISALQWNNDEYIIIDYDDKSYISIGMAYLKGISIYYITAKNDDDECLSYAIAISQRCIDRIDACKTLSKRT